MRLAALCCSRAATNLQSLLLREASLRLSSTSAPANVGWACTWDPAVGHHGSWKGSKSLWETEGKPCKPALLNKLSVMKYNLVRDHSL